LSRFYDPLRPPLSETNSDRISTPRFDKDSRRGTYRVSTTPATLPLQCRSPGGGRGRFEGWQSPDRRRRLGRLEWPCREEGGEGHDGLAVVCTAEVLVASAERDDERSASFSALRTTRENTDLTLTGLCGACCGLSLYPHTLTRASSYFLTFLARSDRRKDEK
jgi:hypothetical protein